MSRLGIGMDEGGDGKRMRKVVWVEQSQGYLVLKVPRVFTFERPIQNPLHVAYGSH